MKILYFTRDYTTHDRRFLLRLVESRHEVWFLRLESDGQPYENRAYPAGVNVVDWEGGRGRLRTMEDLLGLMPAFENVLNDVQPDLVHAGPVQTCGFMTALAGRPLLLMSWGSDMLVDADRDSASRWVTKFTIERANYLACDCKAVRAKMEAFARFDDSKVVEFPWGTDLDRFYPGPPKLSRPAGWENDFVVLSTRSWEPVYGIDVLLDAFARAVREQPRLKLVLVGGGSLDTTVRESIARKGLEPFVHCPGRIQQDQLPEYFRMADLYLSCAHSDGSSISLLEALATGLPAVVTDIASNREWIESEKNGYLGTPGDARSFAAGIVAAAGLSANERQAMRDRNLKLAHARADWRKNGQRLIDFYDRIEDSRS